MAAGVVLRTDSFKTGGFERFAVCIQSFLGTGHRQSHSLSSWTLSFWEDQFSGKQQVWTFSGQSTQEGISLHVRTLAVVLCGGLKPRHGEGWELAPQSGKWIHTNRNAQLKRIQ